MPDWRPSTWGDEISLEYGKGIRGYAEGTGPIRVFGTNGPVGWTDQPLANGPGVILGRKGAYRGVHYSPDPFYVIDTAYYAVPKSPLNMRWLYYAMIYHELGLIDDGSPIPSTTRAAVYPRELQVPSPDEQQAIAGVLGSLDDKIEQNRRTGAKLEGLARAVFKAWFVDFEPVQAKAAGATAFPGMPSETFAPLPRTFQDAPLGPIPLGWDVGPIGDVVTVRGGGTPSTKDEVYWKGGTHFWATPKDLSALQHPVLLSTARRITDDGVAKISSGVLPVDTALLSSRAPVGYLALAKVPTAVNQGFIAVTCDGRLKPHFILHWLHANMEEIKGRASGTTFAEISKTAFRPIPAIVPPPALINAFENVAKPMFDMITHMVAESAELAALRDYLLPRLLSGRVRVGAAERIEEKVAR